MSSFTRSTKHPKTGIEELASWLDNRFGHHRYGVFFPSDESIWDESLIEDKETDV